MESGNNKDLVNIYAMNSLQEEYGKNRKCQNGKIECYGEINEN